MNFLYKAQYCFTETFSTQHAILDTVPEYDTNKYRQKNVYMWHFLDFKKAFDSSTTLFYLINCTIMGLEVLYLSGLRRTWLIEHKQRTLTMTATWRPHIDHIASKISKIAGIIARLRHHVPLNTLLQIYRSLIFPYFTLYGIPVWGQASQCDLKRFSLCKSAHSA